MLEREKKTDAYHRLGSLRNLLVLIFLSADQNAVYLIDAQKMFFK